MTLGGHAQHRALLLGGAHSDVPLVLAARRLGWHVTAVSSRTSDPGHAIADESVHADFSDVEAVRRCAESNGATGIIAGCNDFAALTAARIAEDLGLAGHDSHETAMLIHHKDRFGDFARAGGIPVPQSASARSLNDARIICEEIGFPVLVKPTDLTGGKGIAVARGQSELTNCWETARAVSRRPTVLIQRFLEGTNHAVTCLLDQSGPRFMLIDNEHYFDNKFLVGAASLPTRLDPATCDAVMQSVRSIAAAVDLAPGVLHLQFMVTQDGRHHFLDVCRRCPGDLYPEMVELATGVRYVEQIVRAQLGLDFDLPAGCLEPTPRPVARVCVTPTREGTFLSVTEGSGPGRVVSRTSLMQVGDPITDHLIQKVEIAQLEFDEVHEPHTFDAILRARLSVAVA